MAWLTLQPTSLASHLTSPAGNLSYSRSSRVVRLIAWQEVLVLIPSAVMTPLKALSTPQPHRAILGIKRLTLSAYGDLEL